MGFRASLSVVVAFSAVLMIATGARAFDESRYPPFSGIWRKPVGIGNQWDQTKPLGRAQEPPFTPEYQAIFEARLVRWTRLAEGDRANLPWLFRRQMDRYRRRRPLRRAED